MQIPCKFQINWFINNRAVDDLNTRAVDDQGTRAVDDLSIRAVNDPITRAVDDPSTRAVDDRGEVDDRGGGARRAAIAALRASIGKYIYNTKKNSQVVHCEANIHFPER